MTVSAARIKAVAIQRGFGSVQQTKRIPGKGCPALSPENPDQQGQKVRNGDSKVHSSSMVHSEGLAPTVKSTHRDALTTQYDSVESRVCDLSMGT